MLGADGRAMEPDHTVAPLKSAWTIGDLLTPDGVMREVGLLIEVEADDGRPETMLLRFAVDSAAGLVGGLMEVVNTLVYSGWIDPEETMAKITSSAPGVNFIIDDGESGCG